ncbi:MAG: response regulator [Myxococcales bacterium]|nr:response regulator [Myxococcales bacterium]
MAGILRRAGYTLLVAEDAADALRIAAHHGAAIDLLISDVVMHQAGRLLLAAQVRALRPAIALLHMSGHADDTTRQGLHDNEGVFLQKPLTPELLRRKVREALATRSGTSR